MFLKGKVAAAFFLAWAAGGFSVRAGGFQVPILGQKQNAMGVAGTGVCLDASSILFNPGAAAFLKKNAIQCSVSPIIARVGYRENAPGAYTTQNDIAPGFPFSVFASFNIPPNKNSQWKAGLGVYTPFGTRLRWPSDWKGRFVVQDVNLFSVFVQPTVSYRLGDRMGFGGGLILAYGGVDLQRALPLSDAQSKEGSARLSGGGIGFGVNLGFYVQPTRKLSVGINYRSPVSISVKNGTAQFSVPTSIKSNFPDTKFSSSLTLPQSINIGAGYKLNKKWLFLANLDVTNWSVFDTLRFDFTQNTSVLRDERQPRRYNNSFAVRLGAQYEILKGVKARGGLLFDRTPIDDDHLSPELPDGNLYGITAGGGIELIDNLQIDFSFMFIFNTARTARYRYANFGGTYQGFLFIPGVGAQFSF